MSVLLAPGPRSLRQWDDLGRARAALDAGAPRVVLEGLGGSATALALAGLLPAGTPACLVAADRATATRLLDDLRGFGTVLATKAADEILLLPLAAGAAWRGGEDREADAERAAILGRLQRGEPAWVIGPPAALLAPMPAAADFRRQLLRVAVGDRLDRDLLLDHLAAAGYERVEAVTAVGQWSVRGGIVDVFSPERRGPVRLELDGDLVDSLRAFDPTSQRSTGAVESLLILPLQPAGAGPGTLFDYLPAGAPVVVAEPARLEPGVAAELALAVAGRPLVECQPLVSDRPDAFRVDARALPGFHGQLGRLRAALEGWGAGGLRVRLLASDPQSATRLQAVLRDLEREVPVVARLLGEEGLAIVVAGVHGGCLCPGLGLVCLTEAELFGARRTLRRRATYERGGELAALADLQPGDLVVHLEHGIGRYRGLVTLAVDGQEADFLHLEYAEGGRLYLPVQRLDAVSKYVGAAGAPRLDKLGGVTWQKTKEAVRASVRELAGELLQLYAARQVVEGVAIGADTPWQHEMEAAFPFEETPDQLEAIGRVKADLERRRPMDRLVCGDVGYGKTEVAMRAALKVALDGHQVAVLVPTTVLAQQHWNTFRERFAPYPVRIEMLSRFRPPAGQKAVLAGLAQGTVDVVIGTHRLLSRDVVFKDLGLLVVDEEHRFGVTHKERLKQLRKAVHVLTLTATPIPRTLSMALSGIRDLSVIETPPADRLAVDTVVCRFDPHVIKEAIERELARGGQVFVVHNRIQSLPALAHFLERLVPRARIAMAHGQMRPAALERTMLRYVAGEFDVLVSTAIIESGLDIPASNTIIINRADRLGLAQLYQLRGRVGRDRLQAHAYLLIPADGRVDDLAGRRLRVIQELTALGSGLKIALRDLEIRGAGNLLGAEQHGQIEAVGFDLYLKLLEEAVRQAKGEPVAEEADPLVTADVAAHLPESYVRDAGQRLGLYRRLAATRTAAEVDALRVELADRFGRPPAAVEQLLDVVRLRQLARTLGLERLEVRAGRALLTFGPRTAVTPERLLRVLRTHQRRLRLVREFVVEATLPRGSWRETVGALSAQLGEFLP